MPGTRVYLGIPRSGKTTLAVREACDEAAATGRTLLICDSIGVVQVAGALEPARGDWRAAIAGVWQARRHVRFIPDGPDDVERIAAAAFEGRNVVLLLDEIGVWSSGRSIGDRLGELIRSARHRDVSLFVTTQYAGDVPSFVLQCADEARIFRHTSRRALERISEEFHLDEEQVRALPPYEFVRWAAWA